MTKAQKELIEKAKKVDDWNELEKYKFEKLYIINSGKKYGNIDYNYITIVGETYNKEYILITDYSDVYQIIAKGDTSYKTDIPRELNCIRHFALSNKCYFKIITCLSNCNIEITRD